MQRMQVKTPHHLSALLFTLLLALAMLPLNGCSQKPEYQPIAAQTDAKTNQAYLVLSGYLKRRDILIQKSNVGVKHLQNELIFRCQTDKEIKLYSVTDKNGAWKISEISTQEILKK